MPANEIFNYKKISETLVSSGLASEEQLAELAAQGFSTVVNLLPEDNEYVLPSEATIIKNQGLEYHLLPVDFSRPTQADFEAFSSIMTTIGNKKTLLHCAANYRVSAFYALYAQKFLDWTEQQAEDFIQSIWNPDDYPPWRAFIESIKKG